MPLPPPSRHNNDKKKKQQPAEDSTELQDDGGFFAEFKALPAKQSERKRQRELAESDGQPAYREQGDPTEGRKKAQSRILDLVAQNARKQKETLPPSKKEKDAMRMGRRR
jgi:hypothetical protein